MNMTNFKKAQDLVKKIEQYNDRIALANNLIQSYKSGDKIIYRTYNVERADLIIHDKEEIIIILLHYIAVATERLNSFESEFEQL